MEVFVFISSLNKRVGASLFLFKPHQYFTLRIFLQRASISSCVISLLAIAFLIITFGESINLTGNSLGLVSTDLDINKEFPVGFLNLDSSSELLQYQTGNIKKFPVITSGNSQDDFLDKENINYKLAKTLDNLSYRTLGIGFPLLTIGILSGAVWANEAWGSYWSWDPKETWALITWIIFAVYLHTRITKGWQGKRPAIIASVGFFVVWICYLGVNLLGKGLHSYGWVQLNI